MSSELKLLHIVRQYGPVGGMDGYVWELTQELSRLGHRVKVLCERCHAEVPSGIEVIELGRIAPKPGWISRLRFSHRVSRWVRNNATDGWLLHSHERTAVHHITTFHGPPFSGVRSRPWWKKISLRVWALLWLEKRELQKAQVIIPNSIVIRGELAKDYPQFAIKMSTPIPPGVRSVVQRPNRQAPTEGGVIGFVGREWQRKGLALGVQIVEEIRRTRPLAEIWVVGPTQEDILHLFSGWKDGYRLLGWQKNMDYLQDFDVLLHPAKAEPYGMVISEAMSARVPVVVSDACGAAADVSQQSGEVVSMTSALTVWVQTVINQLRRQDAPPSFQRSWSDVALEHVALYARTGAQA